MKIKKNRPKETLDHFQNSLQRMERWHLCQKIGVIYYEAPVSFEKLKQIEDFLSRRGVVD
jgi:hypothetical protein